MPGSRPLPRLTDFGRENRAALDDADLKNISLQHDNYFANRDRHRFFDPLERVVRAINDGWTYESAKLAHIDVVSCVTSKTWSKLHEDATQRARIQETLICNCHPHFANTMRLLQSSCYLLCDGRTALEAVDRLGTAVEVIDIVKNDRMAIEIFVGKVTLDDRKLKLAGWNLPSHKFFSIAPEEVGCAIKRLMDWKSL